MTTFNWTSLIPAELVGFDGEDLHLDGVVIEGNLVHLDDVWLNTFSPGGVEVRDIHGVPWRVRLPTAATPSPAEGVSP